MTSSVRFFLEETLGKYKKNLVKFKKILKKFFFFKFHPLGVEHKIFQMFPRPRRRTKAVQ